MGKENYKKRREYMDNLRKQNNKQKNKQNKAEKSEILPKQEHENSGVTITDKRYENFVAARETDRKDAERRNAYMPEVYRQLDKLNEDKGDYDR